MKKLIIIPVLLSLSSCATSYTNATRSQYVGNGVHEIRSDGNKWTKSDDVRNYMFRKAFETCAVEGKGFKIREQADTTAKGTAISDNGYGGLYASNYIMPGGRMLIECDGPIDERLGKEFGWNGRNVAQE